MELINALSCWPGSGPVLTNGVKTYGHAVMMTSPHLARRAFFTIDRMARKPARKAGGFRGDVRPAATRAAKTVLLLARALQF